MAAGPLRERDVLLLGLGPIGKAAARRLLLAGALVHVVEPDGERLRDALDDLPGLRPADLSHGLECCELIFDATPAAGIIDACDMRASTIAAVPGVPSGFTAAAQAVLGPRHIHDPLAIGVAVMAARALA
jgi:pyrrolysine biosynthesis protein PylD